MSHFKERKETNCLNCNAEVMGRYCYVCGQENKEPKQSVPHLASHFFEDITHFDGKFFFTLGTLMSRPGLLTLEYVRGRRMSYLDPIRMYIFTSAIFFLVFFGLFHFEKAITINDNPSQASQIAAMPDASLHKYTWLKYHDSAMTRSVALQLAARKDARDSAGFTLFYETTINNLEQYEAVQHQLPPERRDGWFKHAVIRKQFLFRDAYRKDPKNFRANVISKILHSLPQMLFVSLPLFALILQLLYIRRKQFFYTDHGIFSIHLYIFTFINLLVIFALQKLEASTHWQIFIFLRAGLVLWIFVYLYKAMRNFYGQRRGKTLLKFILLNLIAFFMMTFLFTVFSIFSSVTAV